ncbi:hypothetical protein EII12_06630 [Buchananella hordeovulneris]|nr:hypothetical protein EII12_06630 [Buchananella hordeovulneris]
MPLVPQEETYPAWVSSPARSILPLPVDLRPDAVDQLAAALAAVRAHPGRAPVVFPVTAAPTATVLETLQRGLAALPHTDVVVATTGSTGTPRLVGLAAAALDAAAHATATFLGSPVPAWLLALPPHHIAGLAIIWRSLVAGARLDCFQAPRFTAPALAAALAHLPDGAATSLVPTQLTRALADPAATAQLARLRAVLVGGASLAPAVGARARAAGVPVVRTYGMSETAGGCVYNGRPLPGVRVAAGRGRLRLAGPMLAEGYLDEPTSAAFADGWHVTNDVGEVTDGVVDVWGRADDVVITGGEKVHPARVEEALAPWMQAVCVVGVPDAEWGQRLVALGVGPTRAWPALRRELAAALPRSWVPKELLVVDELPVRGPGKIDRRAAAALARRLGTGGPTESPTGAGPNSPSS